MKQLFLSIVALSLGSMLHAQSRADYNAAISRFQMFYNNNQPDSIFTMFSDRIKTLMPAEKTSAMMLQLNGKMGKMKSYEFIKEEAPLSYYKTEFDNATVSLILSLTKDYKLESFRFVPYEVDGGKKEPSNFAYKSAQGTIYGTLQLPLTDKPVPVVLIIAGSGPTDRNGNQAGMKTNAYKQLADSLLSAGIASLRYDKRGVGESINAATDEEHTRFDDMVADAAGIILQLKKDKRFSKVIVLGHSEGSLVGMIAANVEKADDFISLAGVGEPANKVLQRQIETNLPAATHRAKVIMDSINNGYTVTAVDADLQMLFRSSVQPYMRSWFKYDPKVEISKLNIPVLILQGTTDRQVTVGDAAALIKASPRAYSKYIDGMNHVLKQAPADKDKNLATYNMPDLPLSPGLMPPIYKLIKDAK